MANLPTHGWKVYLSGNRDLPNYEAAGDIVIICSSLIKGSTNRPRTESITIEGEERMSQEALLAEHGLAEVNNDIARVIAGMVRLRYGFPANVKDVGTPRDPGDLLLEGMVIRTKIGPLSSCVACSQVGVDGFCEEVSSGGADSADDGVGVIGVRSLEFKAA
jgi:hypothetical protein